MSDPQHVLAESLESGAVFLQPGSELRMVVLGDRKTWQNLLRYKCQRADTGETGWCQFTVGESVLLAPEHTPGLTPVCDRCKALGHWDGTQWVHHYSKSAVCRTGSPWAFRPQRVTPVSTLTLRSIA
jgi:hypothetical protein